MGKMKDISKEEFEKISYKNEGLVFTDLRFNFEFHIDKIKNATLLFGEKGCFFKNCEFKEKVVFLNYTFKGEAVFINSTFEKGASFENSTFEKEAYFKNSTFENGASFINSTFEKEADFYSSKFEKGADFYSSKFKERADFKNSTFEKFADFYGSKFEKGADFYSSKFKEWAFFKNSTFENGAFFENSTFENGAYFYSSKFKEWAFFKNSTFENGAFFKNSTFEKFADFQNSTFEKFADFYGSTFCEKTIFILTSFEGNVSFSNAKFKENVSFKYTTIEKSLILQRTKILKGIDLSLAVITGNLVVFHTEIKDFESISDITNDEKYERETNKGHIPIKNKRETFRILKNHSIKQENRVDALGFKALEYKTLFKEKCSEPKKKLSNLFDIILLFLNRISNRWGSSYMRGIIFTLLVALLFFSLSLSCTNAYELSFTIDWSLTRDFLNFLNPTHSFDYLEESVLESEFFYILDFLGRLSVGYGIYQTIQAFRKYR